jgi:putative endonuclease
MKSLESPWFVYVLECRNGRLYTGITTNLEDRFSKHCRGKGAMFTRMNRPLLMIGATPCRNRSEASRLEWQVKLLKPQQKRALAVEWPLRG